jgi:hypothetical protein
MESLTNTLAIEGISFDKKNQWVRCLAHIINLAVQSALTSLKAAAVDSEDAILEDSDEEIEIESASVISKVSWV